MESCVFCGIVEGKIPAHRIAANADFLAFLGIFPKNPGMTVVVSKKHFGSYLYRSMTVKQLEQMHDFARKVALEIDQALGSIRCIQLMEGFEVDHAHLKLYPVYKDVLDSLGDSTSRASDQELEKVAEKIRKAGGLK